MKCSIDIEGKSNSPSTDYNGSPFMMISLKMTTINVNGIRHTPKRRAFFKDLRDTKSDIIFLQETHSSISDCKLWKTEWGGEAVFSHGSSNSKGVAILFARGLDIKILFQTADLEGRYLLLNIEIDDKVVTLSGNDRNRTSER